MRTPDGVVVGRHQGLAYYTLGQRQGLGIGGTHGGSSEPWFVAGKDPASNALLVVQGHGDRRLYSSVVETDSMHWIAGTEPTESRQRVRFDAPQWAPTPGQYLVVYDGEVCLGGAVIESAHNEDAIGAGRRAERIAVEG